jgi:hypothetical protein
MSDNIKYSGFYQDNFGRSFLVTQGLVGYTLVAKKEILFRLYLNPTLMNQVQFILVTIKSLPFGLINQSIVLPIGGSIGSSYMTT